MATGEVTEQVLDQVADELEGAAFAVRRIDAKAVSCVLIGVGIGVGIGFYFGYRYNKKKLRAEIFAEAEQEMNEFREFYRQKSIIISDVVEEKPSVEELVAERGYTPQEEVSEEVSEEIADGSSLLRKSTTEKVDYQAIRAPAVVKKTNIFDIAEKTSPRESASKDANLNWDYQIEEKKRNPEEPHVIHMDEYRLNESGYSQTEYTYYTLDDVLVDDDDPQTIVGNRERLIGDGLDHFGHGADDYNVVHIRNPYLELEFVIYSVSESWEEEVAGLQNDDAN